MINILIVKDKDLNEIGALDNAYNVGVKRNVNEVWQSSFSLPIDDEKNNLCSHFNYIDITSASGRYYGLYRIMPTETKKSDNEVTYKCEHVIATLLDDLIDGYMPALINQTTTVNIQRILNLQTTENWVLGNVEFTRYFQYAFENENGLLAPLLSIPKPLNEPYEWTFDTTSYPWTLNLVKSSNDVKAEIRWGKDMKSFDEVSDPSEIVNYIIPKGSGEGKNQTKIDAVNGGVSYLKDDESIAKWGKHPYIWINRTFSDEESLKANAQSLLDQWKDPSIAFKTDSVDLSILPEYQHERKVLNGVTRIIVEDKEYFGRILSEDIPDISKEHDVSYEINNKLDDIATLQADVERKISVNEAYSQGATNLDSYTFNDNADANFPAIIEFPFPDDMKYVNESKLRIKTSKFRGYTRGMKSAGSYIQESEVKTSTTEDGGQFTKSSEVKGSTSEDGGDHHHEIFILDVAQNSPAPTEWNVYTANSPSGYDVMYLPSSSPATVKTYSSSGNHKHGFSITIPGFQIPAHSHGLSITIPGFQIPGHKHTTEYGIYQNSSLPNFLTVKVDGQEVTFNGIEGEIDITDYLAKDSNGNVTRNYHTIEASPDDLARISMIVTNRFFIQSHIGQQL